MRQLNAARCKEWNDSDTDTNDLHELTGGNVNVRDLNVLGLRAVRGLIEGCSKHKAVSDMSRRTIIPTTEILALQNLNRSHHVGIT